MDTATKENLQLRSERYSVNATRSVGALALKFRKEGAEAYFRGIGHGRNDSPVSAQLRTVVTELRRQNLPVTEFAERLTNSRRPV